MDFVVPMAYNFPPLELESRATIYSRMVGKDRWLINLGVFDGRRQVSRIATRSRHHRLLDSSAKKERFCAELVENTFLPPDTTSGDENDDKE